MTRLSGGGRTEHAGPDADSVTGSAVAARLTVVVTSCDTGLVVTFPTLPTLLGVSSMHEAVALLDLARDRRLRAHLQDGAFPVAIIADPDDLDDLTAAALRVVRAVPADSDGTTLLLTLLGAPIPPHRLVAYLAAGISMQAAVDQELQDPPPLATLDLLAALRDPSVAEPDG